MPDVAPGMNTVLPLIFTVAPSGVPRSARPVVVAGPRVVGATTPL